VTPCIFTDTFPVQQFLIDARPTISAGQR
jgi:hypothetical protein